MNGSADDAEKGSVYSFSSLMDIGTVRTALCRSGVEDMAQQENHNNAMEFKATVFKAFSVSWWSICTPASVAMWARSLMLSQLDIENK